MHPPKNRQRKMSYIFFVVLILILLGLTVAYLKRPIGNYAQPVTPKLHGEYINPSGPFDGEVRVVTWNLHQAANLPGILATLKTAAELQNTDVYLFQEIDVASADEIAKELNLNYVYASSVYDRKTQKELGNAIFSKWPMQNPEEIVLPNWFPGWVESRNAVKVNVSLGGQNVVFYSVHTDVLRMEPQAAFLAMEIPKQVPTIIGGDFNTWRPSSIISLENSMKDAGLNRLTSGTGYTFETGWLKFTLDHIFANSGLEYTSGVYRETNASDHYPAWAVITIPYNK